MEIMEIMDIRDIIDIMDSMNIMDIMDSMDIMDIKDIMDIMIITAWMAMAGAVSALVLMDIVSSATQILVVGPSREKCLYVKKVHCYNVSLAALKV